MGYAPKGNRSAASRLFLRNRIPGGFSYGWQWNVCTKGNSSPATQLVFARQPNDCRNALSEVPRVSPIRPQLTDFSYGMAKILIQTSKISLAIPPITDGNTAVAEK